jgi:cbb3-type cytochrome oxidase subunit 3
MISKKKRIVIFIVFIVIVIAVFYFLARMGEKEQINNSTNLGDEMKTELVDIEEGDIIENEVSTSTPETEENIEAVNIDENGVDVRRQASIEAQAREMPFPGIDSMGLEFMNDEEKEEFRIPSNREAQILTRDFNGQISSYKVVRQAEDIVYPN